jgi:hypothetical protein
VSAQDTDRRSLRSLEGASPFNPCLGRSGSNGRRGQLRADRRRAQSDNTGAPSTGTTRNRPAEDATHTPCSSPKMSVLPEIVP